VLGVVDNSQSKRARIIELSRRLRHRGPDWSGLHCHQDCYLSHQRLAIVDPTSGDQPLYNEDKTVFVTVRILSSFACSFFNVKYTCMQNFNFVTFSVETMVLG